MVGFIGHNVFGDGIIVDPKKIKAVKNLPRLLSPSNTRNFLILARYSTRFVEGFSSITSPLTRFIQKKVKF